jgi:hypothetical protein
LKTSKRLRSSSILVYSELAEGCLVNGDEENVFDILKVETAEVYQLVYKLPKKAVAWHTCKTGIYAKIG